MFFGKHYNKYIWLLRYGIFVDFSIALILVHHILWMLEDTLIFTTASYVTMEFGLYIIMWLFRQGQEV
jgi:hypothetical protein